MPKKAPTTPESKPRRRPTIGEVAKGIGVIAVAANVVAVPITLLRYDVHDPLKVPGAMGEGYRKLFYRITDIDRCPDGDLEQMQQKILAAETASGSVAEQLEQAHRNGAEFVSRDDLSATEERLSQASGMQVKIDIVSDFTQRNFGFKTVVTKKELAQMDPQVLSPALESFVGYSSLFPTNLMQKIDLDALQIKPKQPEGSTNGQYNTIADKMWIDATALLTPSVFAHEAIGHGPHDTVCHGTYENDRSFPGLNPPGYEYTGSVKESWKVQNNPTVNTNQYGQTSMVEDVASTTQAYLTEDIQFTEKNIDTPVALKVALILSRMDMLAPGSADALLAARPVLRKLQADPGVKYIPELLPGD